MAAGPGRLIGLVQSRPPDPKGNRHFFRVAGQLTRSRKSRLLPGSHAPWSGNHVSLPDTHLQVPLRETCGRPARLASHAQWPPAQALVGSVNEVLPGWIGLCGQKTLVRIPGRLWTGGAHLRRS